MIRSEVINRGIDYIISHLNDDISIEDVAKHCNYSKFYFCRMFKDETGQSLYAFIKRLKMNQSAISLQLENGKSITDIGLDYGYSSTNYSQAFHQHHKVSPSEFRRETNGVYFQSPFYQDDTRGYQSFDELNKKVTLQTLEKITVAYERYIDNYISIKDKWKLFLEKYSDHIDANTQFIERAMDDPTITDLNMCTYDLCFTINRKCTLNNISIISGGLYACYSYKGPVEGIYTAVQEMVHGWLPYSSYEKADRFALNMYRKMDTQNLYVEMDVCLSVKKARFHKSR